MQRRFPGRGRCACSGLLVLSGVNGSKSALPVPGGISLSHAVFHGIYMLSGASKHLDRVIIIFVSARAKQQTPVTAFADGLFSQPDIVCSRFRNTGSMSDGNGEHHAGN